MTYRYTHCPNCGVALTNNNILGLSDGSSIYAWRCQSCGNEWERHAFMRGNHQINDLTSRSVDLVLKRMRDYLAGDPVAIMSKDHVESIIAEIEILKKQRDSAFHLLRIARPMMSSVIWDPEYVDRVNQLIGRK